LANELKAELLTAEQQFDQAVVGKLIWSGPTSASIPDLLCRSVGCMKSSSTAKREVSGAICPSLAAHGVLAKTFTICCLR
jgi:hypothetical protein